MRRWSSQGLRRQLWKAAKLLLVYCAVGPLVGLVVFAASMGFATVMTGQPDGLSVVLFFMIFGLVFAHVVGLSSALVAGLVTLALWHIIGREPAWIGVVAGLISFSVGYGSGAVRVLEAKLSPGPVDDDFGIAVLSSMAAVHVLATFVCWLLSRRLLAR